MPVVQNAGIEEPVIGWVSRAAAPITFRKVERKAHDHTRCRLCSTLFRDGVGFWPVNLTSADSRRSSSDRAHRPASTRTNRRLGRRAIGPSLQSRAEFTIYRKVDTGDAYERYQISHLGCGRTAHAGGWLWGLQLP